MNARKKQEVKRKRLAQTFRMDLIKAKRREAIWNLFNSGGSNMSRSMSADEIELMLESNPVAVESALVGMYERQMTEARVPSFLRHDKPVRFKEEDREFLASCAIQIRQGRSLTPSQLPIARRKMKRHIHELMNLLSRPPIESMVDVFKAPSKNPEPQCIEDIREQAIDDFGSW